MIRKQGAGVAERKVEFVVELLKCAKLLDTGRGRCSSKFAALEQRILFELRRAALARLFLCNLNVPRYFLPHQTPCTHPTFPKQGI